MTNPFAAKTEPAKPKLSVAERLKLALTGRRN